MKTLLHLTGTLVVLVIIAILVLTQPFDTQMLTELFATSVPELVYIFLTVLGLGVLLVLLLHSSHIDHQNDESNHPLAKYQTFLRQSASQVYTYPKDLFRSNDVSFSPRYLPTVYEILHKKQEDINKEQEN